MPNPPQGRGRCLHARGSRLTLGVREVLGRSRVFDRFCPTTPPSYSVRPLCSCACSCSSLRFESVPPGLRLGLRCVILWRGGYFYPPRSATTCPPLVFALCPLPFDRLRESLWLPPLCGVIPFPFRGPVGVGRARGVPSLRRGVDCSIWHADTGTPAAGPLVTDLSRKSHHINPPARNCFRNANCRRTSPLPATIQIHTYIYWLSFSFSFAHESFKNLRAKPSLTD